jgi:periplasmic protein TonB
MKTIRFLMLVFAISGMMALAANSQEPVKKGNVYVQVEQMPEFPGGIDSLMSYMMRTVKYPADAKAAGTTGKVFISFVVDEKGRVTDSKVERGVSPSLDNEALRVVNAMPAWKPGKQGGKVVKVAYTLPIQFALK